MMGPGMEEIIVDIDVPDENGDLKKAYHEEAKDILKAQLNLVYGIHGLIWSNSVFERKRKALLEIEKLYCENDVKETRRLFRNIFFSNNMLKRHHMPMRRGER